VPRVSKQRKGWVAKKLGLGVLASILAFTLGCSADNIVGPGDVSGPQEIPGQVEILAEEHGKDIEPIHGVSPRGGATLIRADVGGVVSWGRFQVEIPAGALSEDTEIKISRPDPGLVMCELEPHGIQFNKPVTLQINYGGTIAADREASMPSLGVYWLNEDTGEWEMVGRSVDVGANRMEAQLEHFSKYGSGAIWSTDGDSKYGSGAVWSTGDDSKYGSGAQP
jgi:hypothetical protein